MDVVAFDFDTDLDGVGALNIQQPVVFAQDQHRNSQHRQRRR
jgi:hypothetical protein